MYDHWVVFIVAQVETKLKPSIQQFPSITDKNSINVSSWHEEQQYDEG